MRLIYHRSPEATDFDIDNLDESFLWNSYMISPLVKFRSHLLDHERAALDASRMLTSVIRGFVLTVTIPNASSPIPSTQNGLPSTLTLISRLSCRRAGTRFNSRGIDDDGNVANFVETETVFHTPSGICFSYAQVRGSVPVFYEQQPSLLPGKQNITLTRGKEGTQPAFDKHFEELEKSYGSVHVINLLSESKPGEADLTHRYEYGVHHCSINSRPKEHELLKRTNFDFHAETKGPGGFEAASLINQLVEEDADLYAYYLSEEVDDLPDEYDDKHEMPSRRSVVVLQQNGVFRTNCLDCLDRTNLIQTIISKMAMEAFFSHKGRRASSDFWMRHSSLWADNGDQLAKIYAGTGALKTSFTRHGKMSIAGAFADARKSATRLYINNFADKGRQNTIDVLLGRLMESQPVSIYDPISDFVNAEMAKRLPEYSSAHTLNIWVGTFNVNGRTQGLDTDLRAWLFPQNTNEATQQPEMYVVGFQEIVNLSPQQIMNSDPSRKKEWEYTVKKHLNDHMAALGSADRYVRLRSGQLVGAALCIYVKASVLHLIKHVEGATKKTGLSGMAGNKGAVAIRMQYANTHICFVTAHLAAGFANYDERNKDFHTIDHGVRFQRNRRIDNHDTIIWLGDFNYRIGMSNDRVRPLIKQGDLSTLYENDQLNIQMVAGLTFPHYSESKITFMPTYKFDVGTDIYDTSEKQRIPAWTDRILRKGHNIRQIHYQSADLHLSDHKPVYATFEVNVNIVDEELRNRLARKLFERRKEQTGGSVANTRQDVSSDEEDLIDYESVEPGLPPASSDRRKWWLDNGQPARSQLQPPAKGMAPNPMRASNPWEEYDEPDWVKVDRPNLPVDKDSYESYKTVQSTRSINPAVAPNPKAQSLTAFDRSGSTMPARKKLPPPYVPTSASSPALPPPRRSDQIADAAFRHLATEITEDAIPTSPPARRNMSVASTASDSSSMRKQPPPVARKPVNLKGVPSPGLKPVHLSSTLASPTGQNPTGAQTVDVAEVQRTVDVDGPKVTGNFPVDGESPQRSRTHHHHHLPHEGLRGIVSDAEGKLRSHSPKRHSSLRDKVTDAEGKLRSHSPNRHSSVRDKLKGEINHRRGERDMYKSLSVSSPAMKSSPAPPPTRRSLAVVPGQSAREQLGMGQADGQAGQRQDRGQEKQKPLLPIRPKPAVDLMSDSGEANGEEMKKWEVLRPG